MTTFAQYFCTVADLVADKQSPGIDEARMFQAIREASETISKEIGWFIPVTLTRLFDGRGSKTLFVPPLLSISSILNDTTALTTADYILHPEGGFWANGPYVQLKVHPDATLLYSWCAQLSGVTITGRWGKYERSGPIGATVADATSQDASQLTLKVSDGGKVSPGMVLLIGSEQEAVTGWGDPTASVTTLNGAVGVSDDVITLANGALVNVGEVLRVDFEQMKVQDKRTHQCSVIRSWNGTGKVAHLTAAAVDVYRTASVERGVNGTTAAVHANGLAISRYFAPDDIQFLCKEIATLTASKALSGYQGRTGNAETGVVFFNDSFPKFDIDKIKSNYHIPRIG